MSAALPIIQARPRQPMPAGTIGPIPETRAAAPSPPVPAPREFMSRRELSGYLRARGIPMSVSSLAKGGGPPPIRFRDGGHLRFEKAVVDAWVEGRKARCP